MFHNGSFVFGDKGYGCIDNIIVTTDLTMRTRYRYVKFTAVITKDNQTKQLEINGIKEFGFKIKDTEETLSSKGIEDRCILHLLKQTNNEYFEGVTHTKEIHLKPPFTRFYTYPKTKKQYQVIVLIDKHVLTFNREDINKADFTIDNKLFYRATLTNDVNVEPLDRRESSGSIVYSKFIEMALSCHNHYIDQLIEEGKI